MVYCVLYINQTVSSGFSRPGFQDRQKGMFMEMFVVNSAFLMKCTAVAFGILVLFAACSDSGGIIEGNTVKVMYKGTLEDGTVFDQSQEGSPLEFTVGSGQLIPGFDRGVVGMKLNETKTVTIPPEDAYGLPNPEMVRNFPKSSMPEGFEPEAGMQITMQDPQGRPVPAKIAGVTDDEVAIDLNHPLAGETLIFEITVVEIVENK